MIFYHKIEMRQEPPRLHRNDGATPPGQEVRKWPGGEIRAHGLFSVKYFETVKKSRLRTFPLLFKEARPVRTPFGRGSSGRWVIEGPAGGG